MNQKGKVEKRQKPKGAHLLVLTMGLAISMSGCGHIVRKNLERHIVHIPAFIAQLKKQIVLASGCAALQDPMFTLGDVTITMKAVIAGGAKVGAPIPIGLVPITVGANISDEETQQIVIVLKPVSVSTGDIEITVDRGSGVEIITAKAATIQGKYLTYLQEKSSAPDSRPIEGWIELGKIKKIESKVKIPDVFANLNKNEIKLLCAGGPKARRILKKALLSEGT